MKTPEEIKKGLECAMAQYDGRCDEYSACVCCPYFADGVGTEDIVAYIQQLEQIIADFTERTAQLEAQLAAPYRQATMKEVAEYMKNIGIDCCYGEDDDD